MPRRKKREIRDYGKYFWVDPATGYSYARVQVPTDARDKNGKIKYKTIKRRVKNLTEADQTARELLDEHNDRGQAFLDGRAMTFQKLSDWYKEEFAVPPVYTNGKKIAGMRSWENEHQKLDRLCEVFGKYLIEEVDEFLLRRYKLKRIKGGVKPATVNREFETIRAMMRKAVKKKWLKEMVDFSELIDKSLEERRTVTITDEEEKRILEEAKKMNYAPRLYPLIIALRDTGARPSELYPVNDYESDYGSGAETNFEPLRWRDLFDEDGNIKDVTRLVSYKGKVREERLCVVTERMKRAFLDLWNYLKYDRRAKNTTPEHQAELDNLVFPQTSFQSAWEVVREKAGLKHVRLRDLRRDFRSRLARLGMPDTMVQRMLGHQTMQMSFNYTEFDLAAAAIVKKMLDTENAGVTETKSENN
ncbi:MAG TPA: tyrosine-type recombinase/integrase [Pyrinomonadaceae bacterium]|jgi:integrase